MRKLYDSYELVINQFGFRNYVISYFGTILCYSDNKW